MLPKHPFVCAMKRKKEGEGGTTALEDYSFLPTHMTSWMSRNLWSQFFISPKHDRHFFIFFLYLVFFPQQKTALRLIFFPEFVSKHLSCLDDQRIHKFNISI